MESHFDAIVIGSGFGGSVMAYNLAKEGLNVCLLERGKTYPPFSFPRAPFKLRDNFWDPSEGLYGMYDAWSFKGSAALVSSGLGGGSLIYANIIIRKDEKWFVDENLETGGYTPWPITRKDLDPHYDRVDKMMNVQQYPLGLKDFPEPPKTLAMQDAARILKKENPGIDLDWLPLNLAVSFRQKHVADHLNPDNIGNPPLIGEPIEEPPNYHKKTRYTCVLCGECDLGCNTGSKNTLDYTYITHAEREGALIKPLCEVKSFAPSGKGYSVTYVEHDPEKWGGRKAKTNDPDVFPRHTITSDRLIISAGTFGSPYLLFKNKDHFKKISKKLGSRFCVNGDLLSFIINSQEEKDGKCAPRVLDPSFGPVITGAIRLGDSLDGNGDQGRGFYVEDGGNPYLMSWGVELTGFMSLLSRSATFAKRFFGQYTGLIKDTNLDAEIAALIGDCEISKSSLPVLTMGRDVPDGNLSYDGKYLNCDWDITNSQEYYDRVVRVVRGIANALNAEYMDNPSYEYLRQVITAHPLGGCPMGTSENDGVVDSYGEVFNYKGLYVMDGSILPGPVGPNPSMTIAAVSDRAARKIATGFKKTRPTPPAGGQGDGQGGTNE